MSETESIDDFSTGDLGLGDGLKPGGIPFSTKSNKALGFDTKLSRSDASGLDQSTESHSGFTTPEDSEDEFEISLMPIRSIQDLKQQYASPKSSRCTETFPKVSEDNHSIYDCRYFQVRSCECQEGTSPSSKDRVSACTCETEQENDSNEKFPVYAEVPFGTSIRQQRELFKHNMDALNKKKSSHSNNKHSHDKTSNQSLNDQPVHKQEAIAMKLASTLQEVEDLKLELDNCEKRLDSKYKAIDILKKQAEEAQLQLKHNELRSREKTIKLAQLQYSSDGAGSRVTSLVVGNEQDLGDISNAIVSTGSHTSQTKRGEKRREKNVSIDKFNRVCQDNASIMQALENRTEELRKVTAQNMSIQRENDELLALLDIQERAKYEKSRSVSSEENYNTFSSTELAVLGACRCRINEPDPCRCAHAAAGLKKEVIRMKEEVLQYKNRRDEAFLTVDAYRKAFEEQLQRNRTLTVQLASIVSNSQTKVTKAKSALRWLIGSLDDDDDISDESAKPGPLMSEHELITYLTELVNEKKEVLAHQKLASQILGDRVKHLEEKLSHYEKESDVFS